MRPIARALPSALALAAAVAFPPLACSAPQAAPDAPMHVTTGPATVEIASPPRAARGRLVLHLDGVQVTGERAAILRVFVQRPGATAATPRTDAGFVEELVLVPSRSPTAGAGTRQKGQNLALPIPEGVVGSGERLVVTLVPLQADAQGRLTEPGAVDLTLKRPYVTIEP